MYSPNPKYRNINQGLKLIKLANPIDAKIKISFKCITKCQHPKTAHAIKIFYNNEYLKKTWLK